MATATQKDDDLLIIADDTESSESSDEISFSFNVTEDESPSEEKVELTDTVSDEKSSSDESMSIVEDSVVQEEPLISIEDSKDTEVLTEEKTVVEEKTSEENTDIDFSIGIEDDSDATQEASEVSTPEVSETSDSDSNENFSLGLGSSQAGDSTQDPKTSGGVNDILAETIKKLGKRKDAISEEKEGKALKEQDIKAKVVELQETVEVLEADMRALDAESEKITLNIAELEKMKLDPVKDHNEKRIKK